MDNSRPRIHLPMLLVMVLIAGAWMMANTIEYRAAVTVREPVYGPDGMRSDDLVTTQQFTLRGFPVPLYVGHPVHPKWNGSAEVRISLDPSRVQYCFCAIGDRGCGAVVGIARG